MKMTYHTPTEQEIRKIRLYDGMIEFISYLPFALMLAWFFVQAI